jgi:serine-type D-Ala-D-Ala carboxypeptidase/endopeptidase (penicillin-binding protein 4)
MLRYFFALIILFTSQSFSLKHGIAETGGTSKEEIRNRVDYLLKRLPSSTKAGVLIYNPLSGDTIYSLNHTASMIPASNTKLFTTAAALSIMGGDYILSTKLLTTDNNTDDGVIDGNLYLKGYGYSLFSEEDMEKMADELVAMGIKKITGSITGDDSYFDNIYTRDDWIQDEVANVKLPPISAIVVNKNRKPVQFRRGKRVRTSYVNVQDPPLNAALMLKDKLSLRGIEIGSGADKGITPDNTFVLSEAGIELRELIKPVNKESDNFLAECLFKSIGAAASGDQGNAFYSTQAILSFIADNGIYSRGTAVVDGSGISRFDQVTVGAITGLLEKMYFDLVHFDDFYNSLSIAGVDGTLKRRMIGSSAENNFRGKTGTLNGVSSLSGYLTCANGEELIVSIFFEFSRGGANLHRNIQDSIVQMLCEWD